MFKELKKIWLDTTTYKNKYVAKDVRGAVSFLVGLVLMIASALGACFNKNISLEAGTFLLVFSLGNQTVKEYFKYKNNTVVAGDTCDEAPPEEKDELN
jgi:hypothetical protein